MPYIGYSPWQDAAEYGKGLGESLTQLLLHVPMVRAQQRQQQYENQQTQLMGPLQMELLRAQIAEANARGQSYGSEAQRYTDQLNLKKQEDADATQRYTNELNLKKTEDAVANTQAANAYALNKRKVDLDEKQFDIAEKDKLQEYADKNAQSGQNSVLAALQHLLGNPLTLANDNTSSVVNALIQRAFPGIGGSGQGAPVAGGQMQPLLQQQGVQQPQPRAIGSTVTTQKGQSWDPVTQ